MRKIIGLDEIYFISILLMICIFWGFIDYSKISLIVQVIFLGLGILRLLINKSLNKYKFFYIVWAVTWFTYCITSYFWSINSEATISYSVSIFQVCVIGSILVLTISNEREITKLEKGIIFAGIILVIRLLIETPSTSWGKERLGLELGMHVNHIATNLLISLMFSLKYLLQSRNKIYLLLSTIFIILIILTASKKAILISILSIFILVPISKKGIFKKVKSFLLMTLLVIIIFNLVQNIPFLYNLAFKRMEGFISLVTGAGVVDKSTEGRQYLISRAWEVFKKYPFGGVGLNGFRFMNYENAYAHSNLLEILASCGLLGFIIYYSLYGRLLKSFFIKYKFNVKYGIYFMVMICILVMEFMQVTYYLESVQIVLAILFLSSINID